MGGQVAYLVLLVPGTPSLTFALAAVGGGLVLTLAYQSLRSWRKNRRWRAEEAAKAGQTLATWPHGSKGRHKRR